MPVPAKKASRGAVVFIGTRMPENSPKLLLRPSNRRRRSYVETWQRRWSGHLLLGTMAVIFMLGLARC